MSGRAAHIEVVDRSAIVGPAGYGPQEEKLLQRKFTLEDVALSETEFALEIERRKYLALDYNFFDIGCVLGDGVHDGVAECVTLIVPGSFRELIRGVLHKAGEHMLARRRDTGIGKTGDDHIDVRATRKMAVLRSS